jgi:hypothetical protein
MAIVLMFPAQLQYQAEFLQSDRALLLKPQGKMRELCARLKLPYYDLDPGLGRRFLPR